MSTNTPFQTPFLRVQRLFPQEAQPLSVEIDRMYVDVANSVNARTIGIFTTGNVIQNGETWYTGGARFQGFRQFYTFSDSNLVQNHNINLSNVSYFTRIWGTFFDGTYWNTLPYIDVVNVTNQINIKISSTQIIVTKGAGTPPTISKGVIILEYITNS